ncbi:MAG: FtsQ-type POTRA domain-containing protein [Chloroflexota bacterium]
MIACLAGMGWLLTQDDFDLDASSLELSGIQYTDSAAVAAIVTPAVSGGQNVFLVNTGSIRAQLLTLPTIAIAEVRAALPNRMTVAITERVPVVAVLHDNMLHIIDGNGVVLDDRALDAPGLENLPVVDDGRAASAISYATGDQVNAVDARAILTLSALTPMLLGSSATALSVSIDDMNGYLVSAAPYGWRAVFGHYTPTLRPPDEIDGQVQCLETILADGEQSLDTVYLAPSEGRCGTYLPLPSAAPSTSPAPS